MFRPYDDSPVRILNVQDGSVVVIRTQHAPEPRTATAPRASTNGAAMPPGGLRIQVYPLDDV